MKFTPFVSKIVLNNPEKFPVELLNRFKDIAVFVVGFFLLPHLVHTEVVCPPKDCHPPR